MKGIIPIKKVSQPRPLTLEFMVDRVSQREIAQGVVVLVDFQRLLLLV